MALLGRQREQRGGHAAVAANTAGARVNPAQAELRFGVAGTPRPNVTLPQLDAAIDAVIDEIADKGVTPEELERAKTRLVADVVYAQDNQATLARWYGAALTTGSTVEQIRTWPERIRAVTADEVREVARLWLQKTRSVTGYLIKDEKRAKEQRS